MAATWKGAVAVTLSAEPWLVGSPALPALASTSTSGTTRRPSRENDDVRTVLPVLMAVLGIACIVGALYGTITGATSPRGKFTAKSGTHSVTGSELSMAYGADIVLLALSYVSFRRHRLTRSQAPLPCQRQHRLGGDEVRRLALGRPPS